MTPDEDEREKKKRWMQQHRMLQDELLKMKFEMIEEGKPEGKITVKSPYLESVSDRIYPTEDKLSPGVTEKRGGETPSIPKPPDLAEHIAKILEHENRIKRIKYQMSKEEMEELKKGEEETGVPEKGEAADMERAPAAESPQVVKEAEGGPSKPEKRAAAESKPPPSVGIAEKASPTEMEVPSEVKTPPAPEAKRPSETAGVEHLEGKPVKETAGNVSSPPSPEPSVVEASKKIDVRGSPESPRKVLKLRVIRKKRLKRKEIK